MSLIADDTARRNAAFLLSPYTSIGGRDTEISDLRRCRLRLGPIRCLNIVSERRTLERTMSDVETRDRGVCDSPPWFFVRALCMPLCYIERVVRRLRRSGVVRRPAKFTQYGFGLDGAAIVLPCRVLGTGETVREAERPTR